MQIDPGEKNVLQEKGETPTVKDRIRKDVFYHEKNLKTGSFAFRRRIDTDCTDRLLAQRRQQFGADKKAVGATLKAAATAKNYDVEINDDLSQRATAILQKYVRGRNTLYDVTDDEASPVEIDLEDNESYGTIVFVMPEKASVPQTWTKACELFVEELWHYTYGTYGENENQAEIGIDIARQVSVNGDEPVDCMIIFAKRHYGASGGDIDTPPIL